jgi:hypothetical protein
VERVETQFELLSLDSTLDVRETVNDAYQKICSTMFDSLQAIAKDTTSNQPLGTKDDDDKEQLNSHISMIENMHYYHECVDAKESSTLVEFKMRAHTLFREHLGLYIKAVVKRPLGKLLVFSFTISLTAGLSTRCGNICTVESIRGCNCSHLLLKNSI